jgi:hypothetical protein
MIIGIFVMNIATPIIMFIKPVYIIFIYKLIKRIDNL